MKKLNQLVLGVVLGYCSVAGASGYPDKPITMLVPFGAGGLTDTIARATARALSSELGQTVIVENKPGAGGNIGADLLKQAKPDGYTIMLATNGVLTVNPHINKNISYDTFKDFAFISTVASTPFVAVVNPSVQASSFKELIALAGKTPEGVSFGSAGIGSAPYQGMVMTQEAASVTFMHVPFKSGAESITNVVGGQVDATFEAASVVMPFVKAGKLKALALADAHRMASVPDIPSTEELGYPAVVAGSLSGLIGPMGLPRDIVDKLNAATRKVVNDRAFRDNFINQGTVAVSSTPEAYHDQMAAKYKKWEKFMGETNMATAK